MDPSQAISIALLIVLVLLSAFFSSAETALTTVNKIRIRNLANDNVKNAKKVALLIEDQSKLLSTILIGNNIVNLSASALTTVLVTDLTSSKWVGLATGILTVIILIFGEIMPKTIAAVKAEKVALRYAGAIYVLTKIFHPIAYVLNFIAGIFMKIVHIDPKEAQTQITEDELLTYVEVSHEEGVIENEEKEMINNVVDFGDALAKDVMVPRTEMKAVPDDISYNDLFEAFKGDKYSRLPVYKETRDNVVGIVYIKDLMFYQGNKKDFNVAELMREAHFTYEFKHTSELLAEMRAGSFSLAIVLDEYGSTAGIVTLEDLLEEIVGEIRDEYDSDEVDDIQVVSDNEFIVEGTTKLEDFNEYFGTAYESDDFDSIAGYVINLIGALPQEGQSIKDGKFTFTVTAIDINRVDKIKVVVDEPEETTEDSEGEDTKPSNETEKQAE